MSAEQLKVRWALCLRQELRSLLKVDDSFQKNEYLCNLNCIARGIAWQITRK